MTLYKEYSTSRHFSTFINNRSRYGINARNNAVGNGYILADSYYPNSNAFDEDLKMIQEHNSPPISTLGKVHPSDQNEQSLSKRRLSVDYIHIGIIRYGRNTSIGPR